MYLINSAQSKNTNFYSPFGTPPIFDKSMTQKVVKSSQKFLFNRSETEETNSKSTSPESIKNVQNLNFSKFQFKNTNSMKGGFLITQNKENISISNQSIQRNSRNINIFHQQLQLKREKRKIDEPNKEIKDLFIKFLEKLLLEEKDRSIVFIEFSEIFKKNFLFMDAGKIFKVCLFYYPYKSEVIKKI